MGKVRFHIDSLANIKSGRDSGWLDPVEDLGLDEGEWGGYTDDEKYSACEEYWLERGAPEIFYEEESEDD